MAWKLAGSLEQLRKQINALAPKRSKASDGTIGDAAHSARKSDHNPDTGGVVRAIDFTHDPKNGMDAEKLAAALIASKDPRIKYIIWNKRILAGKNGPSAWKWRAYSGSNPHTKHIHISVVAGKAGEAGTKWRLDLEAIPDPSAPAADSRPLLKRGSSGEAVKSVQRILGVTPVDGKFGKATEDAVKYFQYVKSLPVDGRVGPYTWAALIEHAKTPVKATPKTAPKPPVSSPVIDEPASPDTSLTTGLAREEIRHIQRMLYDKGYTEVGSPISSTGDFDGIKGPLTDAAILAFRSENNLPLTTDIDEQLVLALVKAEPRKLERHDLPDAEVVVKAPETAANWRTELIAKYGAFGAFFIGVLDWLMKKFEGGKEALDPIVDFISGIPVIVWALLIALVLGGLWLNAKRGKEAGIAAFKDGSRR